MSDDRPEKATELCEEAFTNGNDQVTQRATTRHLYGEVNLYHSQAHIGDSIHNNTYHTHHHHQHIAKQLQQPEPFLSTDLDDKIELFAVVVLCAHTCASIMNLWPCLGIFTWYRHIDLPLRIRIGAAASILKHGVLLGFGVWDTFRNDSALLSRYADQFLLSWLVLTSLNVPRTMKMLNDLDASGQVLGSLLVTVHLMGEIMEHILCVMCLRSRWRQMRGTR